MSRTPALPLRSLLQERTLTQPAAISQGPAASSQQPGGSLQKERERERERARVPFLRLKPAGYPPWARRGSRRTCRALLGPAGPCWALLGPAGPCRATTSPSRAAATLRRVEQRLGKALRVYLLRVRPALGLEASGDRLRALRGELQHSCSHPPQRRRCPRGRGSTSRSSLGKWKHNRRRGGESQRGTRE